MSGEARAGGGGRIAALGERGAARRLDRDAEQVLAMVCAELKLSQDSILQPSRGRAEVAHARQLAMYLCYVALGRRLAAIGRMFGRDRSTASYACARTEDLRDDAAFDALVTRLEQRLEASRPETEAREPIRAAG